MALSLLLLLFQLSTAQNHYLSSFSISDSPWLPSRNLTLLSPNRTFAAGFRRSPSSPSLLLFSIWVRAASGRTVVWSLDPDNPVPATTPLSISPQGRLTLPSPSGRNSFPPSAAGNPDTSSLRLTDDGDLVFANWTSFSSPPTDTILPTQPIPATGTTLSSGSYRLVNASALVFDHGSAASATYWSSGGAFRSFNSTGVLLKAGGDSFLMDDVGTDGVLRRLTLDPDGNLRSYSLVATTRRWKVVWAAVQELCTISGTCGLNAICLPNGAAATDCTCPPGYRKVRGSGDCELKRDYAPSSKFLRLDYVDFPGGTAMEDISPANFDLCRSTCLANSSCTWFGYKFSGYRSCQLHFGPLVYGRWSPASELSSFLRVSSSEPDVSGFTAMTAMIDTSCPVRISLAVPPDESKVAARNTAIIATLLALELLAGVLSFWAFLRKYSKYRDMAQVFGLEFLPAGGPKRFSYSELKTATNDFSNVVGRGGFGVVYKGELSDGRVVAVKRLRNGAGGDEAKFWAEVTIIGRMHHLNLVRMWGFCTEKEQRMLVYEYISNGSLDKFLFEKQPATTTATEADCDGGKGKKVLPVPSSTLDWDVRYRIALGVARAVAYLHEECLEWVLHCDIKPENILIEDDFCPKVSDFGLSKLTDSKDVVTMSGIRGTRGYLAPEWVTQRGPITAKADVYSFGVVLLEIVTGVRNSEVRAGSTTRSEDWYFPRWAFEKAYVEKRVEDILDQRILESYDSREHLAMVERMVKTAMWCLQDRAEARPSMGKVAKMLEGTLELTDPPKPSIFYLTE
ncbi:G-type lectin S-receptor-like serine/threonine-protein kinase [Iris pallida]|uniref:non-specific serine/threonine protein kinase n=1 Tax=Iris pallida TaxID=29817 RepID=A0AAX6I614_IRIPA|nr:G-type lectin S-receptor-like serine/threonine-protein kinase [Iris pallida]